MIEKSSKNRFTFRYSERIHHDKDFQKVLKSGRKVSSPALFVYTYNRKDSDHRCRLGLVVSRKVGIAVDRNRVKRRLREIFRLHKQYLNGGLDILFMPKPGSTKLKYEALKELVLNLLKKSGVYENN